MFKPKNNFLSSIPNLLIIIGIFFQSCTPEKTDQIMPQTTQTLPSNTFSEKNELPLQTTEQKTEKPKNPSSDQQIEQPPTKTPSQKNDLSLTDKKRDMETNWIAQLKEIKKNVDFRFHSESIWKKAIIGHNFDRFDALQTQNDSLARVLYKSGSKLEINENTLVIFDQDPGISFEKPNRKKEDRIIIENGELSGSTKTELWVFSNAGLVKIKAPRDKRNETGQAHISIQKNSKLDIKVNSGSADLIYVKDKKFTKIELNNTSAFSITNQNADFESSTNFDDKKIKTLVQASEQIKESTKAKLIIDSPQEGFISNSKIFEIKGHLTALGGQVIINGKLIPLKEDLTFKTEIELTEGLNLIVFQLIRSDSSVEFFRRNLRYIKPE